MFTTVHSYLLTYVYPRLLDSICLLVFTYVYHGLLMFTYVYHC